MIAFQEMPMEHRQPWWQVLDIFWGDGATTNHPHAVSLLICEVLRTFLFLMLDIILLSATK
jgi:hypothetical protein